MDQLRGRGQAEILERQWALPPVHPGPTAEQPLPCSGRHVSSPPLLSLPRAGRDYPTGAGLGAQQPWYTPELPGEAGQGGTCFWVEGEAGLRLARRVLGTRPISAEDRERVLGSRCGTPRRLPRVAQIWGPELADKAQCAVLPAGAGLSQQRSDYLGSACGTPRRRRLVGFLEGGEEVDPCPSLALEAQRELALGSRCGTPRHTGRTPDADGEPARSHRKSQSCFEVASPERRPSLPPPQSGPLPLLFMPSDGCTGGAPWASAALERNVSWSQGVCDLEGERWAASLARQRALGTRNGTPARPRQEGLLPEAMANCVPRRGQHLHLRDSEVLLTQ